MQLTEMEARVFGCLVEKSLTTPEYYPLTLNALVSACNQKSNRSPVMALDATDVLQALDQLRLTHHLACETAVAGSRVPKYKHTAEARLNLDAGETAVLCELLLRGPQTAAELRSRSSRMVDLPQVSQVEAILERLETAEFALVVRLPLEPGRREVRYQHLLCGVPEQGTAQVIPEDPVRSLVTERDERMQRLEETVEKQQQAIAELQAAFEAFRRQFE